MNEKLIKEIGKRMEEKNTNELIRIWRENKKEEWSEEAFESIRRILVARGENLPIRSEKRAKECSTNQEVAFCMTEFLAVVIKGVMLALIATISLLSIGFLVNNDKSPLMPEGVFSLITFVLLVIVLGGFSSGGMYVRHIQKIGARVGIIKGVIVGMFEEVWLYKCNLDSSKAVILWFNDKEKLIRLAEK